MVILFEFLAAAFFFSFLKHTNSRFTVLSLSLLVLFLLVLPISIQPVYSNINVTYTLLTDCFSFWFSYLVLIVLVSSVLVMPYGDYLITLMFFMLFLACYLVFSASDILTLYVSYELSLVPILYIIVNSGSYSDRSLSALYMFVYTAFFSFPFMIYVTWAIVSTGSAHFFLLYYLVWGSNPYVMLFAFAVFIVNLPVYGFHFWLPMAHVEAPTHGSIILAGLLLNIGGCGLMRLANFTLLNVINSVWLSFIVLSLILSSIICCIQSDFNRLVAYSSVAHIIVVVLAIYIGSNLSLDSFFLVMLLHGLSSPMLFLLVGVSYRLFSSRILVLYRGLIISYPFLSGFFILCFVLSVPVPPSIAFFAEVQFVTSLISYSTYISFAIMLFIFLGVLYNLFWLGSLFGSHSLYSYSVYSFSCLVREYFSLFFLSFISIYLIVLLI